MNAFVVKLKTIFEKEKERKKGISYIIAEAEIQPFQLSERCEEGDSLDVHVALISHPKTAKFSKIGDDFYALICEFAMRDT